MDGKHLRRFQSKTSVFKFLGCSEDEMSAGEQCASSSYGGLRCDKKQERRTSGCVLWKASLPPSLCVCWGRAGGRIGVYLTDLEPKRIVFVILFMFFFRSPGLYRRRLKIATSRAWNML